MESLPEPLKTEVLEQGDPIKGSRYLAMRIEESYFQGPIPPPALLEGYERIHPGLANRLVTMAEKTTDHVIQQEAQGQRASIVTTVLGQTYGFVIALSFLGAGTYLASNGQALAGAFLGAGGLAGIVTSFLKSRYEHRRDTESKKEES